MYRFASLLLVTVMALAGWMVAAIPAAAQQSSAGSGASVDDRLSRLEERILDMQSVIGTLQSFVESRSAPGSAAPPQQNGAPSPSGDSSSGGSSPQNGAAPSELAIQVQAMETQIQALTSQVEQITNQLARIESRLGGAPAPSQQGLSGPAQQGALPEGLRGGAQQPDSGRESGSEQQVPAFGTTVSREQESGQQQGRLPYGPSGPRQDGPQGAPVPPMNQTDAADAATASSGQARAAYERSYSHLVRRDFAAAEAGFRDFLRNHPDDALASNAHYWLGETYYVRGNYKKAADTFLEGYKKYNDGVKAPDSLLKLGMSLNQLGETEAACSTLAELEQKFPDSPEHLKQRAAAERERAGC